MLLKLPSYIINLHLATRTGCRIHVMCLLLAGKIHSVLIASPRDMKPTVNMILKGLKCTENAHRVASHDLGYATNGVQDSIKPRNHMTFIIAQWCCKGLINLKSLRDSLNCPV